jgi:hypothetical protein
MCGKNAKMHGEEKTNSRLRMWETIIFAFLHKYTVWKRGKWIIYTWTIVRGYGGIIEGFYLCP